MVATSEPAIMSSLEEKDASACLETAPTPPAALGPKHWLQILSASSFFFFNTR